ncbi:MAG: 3'-5' exonuclease domain-containing protein 2 [Paludibacter sp.]|jgi:ribonuclease D|nr:3'-5' exonuclease domain-containing protein 2 [Paludibacter sp.]
MYKAKITKEEVNNLPAAAYNGLITVIDKPELVGDAVKFLRAQSVVGIDTETKPTFASNQHNSVALLQVATLDRCFLFRLNKINFSEELSDFLEDEKVKKIGLAVRDDFAGLNRQRKFKPANSIDLQNIVRNYGILELGLQKIFAIVFGQKISKSQRLSNWENPTLTPQQQLYAATDAWATLLIYSKLSGEPTLSQSEINRIIAENTPQPPINENL